MYDSDFHNKNGSQVPQSSLKQSVYIKAEKIIVTIDFNLAQFCL